MTQPMQAELDDLERRFREMYGAPPALLDLDLLRRVVAPAETVASDPAAAPL